MRKTIIPIEVWEKIVDYLNYAYPNSEILEKRENYYGTTTYVMDLDFNYVINDTIKRFNINNKNAQREIKNFVNSARKRIREEDLSSGDYEAGESYPFDWSYELEKWIGEDSEKGEERKVSIPMDTWNNIIKYLDDYWYDFAVEEREDNGGKRLVLLPSTDEILENIAKDFKIRDRKSFVEIKDFLSAVLGKYSRGLNGNETVTVDWWRSFDKWLSGKI